MTTEQKTKKTNRLIVRFVGIVLVTIGEAAHADELNIKQIAELLDGSLQSIRSFDVRVECTTRFFLKTEGVEKRSSKKEVMVTRIRKLRLDEKSSVRHDYFRQKYQSGKGRVELLGTSGEKAERIAVFDNEVQRGHDAVRRTASITGLRPRLLPYEGTDYRSLYRIVYGHFPIVDCLRERKDWTVKTDANDNSLIHLESAPQPEAAVMYAPFGFRITLNKRYGFLPVSRARTIVVEGKSFIECVIKVTEWKDIGSGIWVPVKAIVNDFNLDNNSETFGEMSGESVVVIDVARSTWNRQIPEDAFNLTLPAGTKVVDELRGVQFITGKPDTGQNLESLAEHARKVVPFSMAGPPRPPASSWRPWVAATLGAVNVIVLGLVAFSLVRLRKRERLTCSQ